MLSQTIKISSTPVIVAALLGIAGGGGRDHSALPAALALERVAVAPDGRGFVLVPSGKPFVPWGFNYDHDEAGRLLEEYWAGEWPTVEADFAEMQGLGANVVRVHLQVGRFLRGPREADPAALAQLDRLLALAERRGLYLDITGLACYLKEEVPAWYDALEEEDRWAAQAVFWDAVAARGARSSAVFCYDLMNEPVVPGGDGRTESWLGPPFAGKYHFVQFIARERRGRERPSVAREWVRRLAAAVRARDPGRLVTVGLVPWSLDRPGLTSGFVPAAIAPELDFLAVHIYPEAGKLDEALDTLKGFAVGKPVVIEEVFPLHVTAPVLRGFLERSMEHAAGWIGFYWGKTLEECRASTTLKDAIVAAWLELFRQGPPKR